MLFARHRGYGFRNANKPLVSGMAVLLSLLLFACGGEPAATAPPVKAILGGTLIDGTPRPPQVNSVIIIADGKIQAIGTLNGMEIPENAEKTNATGLYVTPGRGGLQLIPGAEADIFLVNGNPLDNPHLLGSPMRSMKAGEWVDGSQN